MTTSNSEKPGIVLKIQKDLMSGQLNLPVMPEIALQIRKHANNPDISLKQLSSYIEAEPALTAHIMCVANSPLFRGVKKVEVLQAALTRMGLKSISDLVMTYCTKSLYKSRNPKADKLLKNTWQQSTYCAAIAATLSQKLNLFNSDRAMLAGLMQDIGTLPILDKLSDYPEILDDSALTEEIIQRYSSQVGVQVLTSWYFDEDMIEVVRERENWQRDQQGKADLTDLILVAKLHSYIGTEQGRSLPLIDSIPAFQKLPCGELTPDQSLSILSDAKQDIAEIQGLLT